MPLSPAALDRGGEAIAAAYGFVQFHSAAPGANGTDNVIAGGRFPIDLDSTNGNLANAAQVSASGLTPGASVAAATFWTLAAAGEYGGSASRSSGDGTVNASGEYNIPAGALVIPVSST